MLDGLAALNHQLWKRRGTRTAFESERFVAFHRALIERAFSMGAIQMLRFSARGNEIGYMYNFVYRGKVYFYQSGLAYSENKRVRPGFVCIGQSVTYCLGQEHLAEFHLMPGGDHYKESMATNSQEIEWLLARNTNAKIRAVDLLRSIKRRIKPVPAPAITASTED
jgi:CelD/BcsL family acetyltransferase involved in cellulose biosynthesis